VEIFSPRSCHFEKKETLSGRSSLKTAPSELPFDTGQEVDEFLLEKKRKPNSVHPAGRYGPLKFFGPWSKPFAEMRKMGLFRLPSKCSRKNVSDRGLHGELKTENRFG
jgi:hypothetical protein